MCNTVLMSRWDHTTSIIASTYNARQGVKRNDWIDPIKLNPYRKRKHAQSGKVKLEDFARAFGAK